MGLNEVGNRTRCPKGHDLLKASTFVDGKMTCGACLRGEPARRSDRHVVVIERIPRMRSVVVGKPQPYEGDRPSGIYNLPDRNVIIIAKSMASVMRVARFHRTLMERGCA